MLKVTDQFGYSARRVQAMAMLTENLQVILTRCTLVASGTEYAVHYILISDTEGFQGFYSGDKLKAQREYIKRIGESLS